MFRRILPIGAALVAAILLSTPADLLALPAMTLATSSPAGDPHAAPVYFASGTVRMSMTPQSV